MTQRIVSFVFVMIALLFANVATTQQPAPKPVDLLMIGNRAKDSVWMKTSLAMVEAGNQIIDACEACHETHWIR